MGTNTTDAIVHQLAIEYNTLIFTAASSQAQRDINSIRESNSLTCSNVFESEDEIDDQLQEIEEEMIVLMAKSSRKRPNSYVDDSTRQGKKRGSYDMRRLYFTNPNTMEREVFTFWHSTWYCNYMVNPRPQQRKWARKFRIRFRLPYHSFLDLLHQCTESEYFGQWCLPGGRNPYNKRETTPMTLLLLCALRYLGRALTVDDLEEYCGISGETIRQFIHKFHDFGSQVLYNKYVKNPQNSTEMKDYESEYSNAGFPGCIASTDATHVVIETCQYRLRQLHLGYKLAHTARTYNMTVNHRRRILHTTAGHPARFNDKTLVLYDDFINRLHNGKYNNMHDFTLKAFGANGEIIKQKYKGAYVIVDNGYLNWSVTVPPMRTTSYRTEIRFSQWLESLRKDVECAFGILKRRWRILKTGIRVHGVGNCDKVWLTCCALHNMLLEIDGLSSQWEEGINCDYNVEDDMDDMPYSIQRLINPVTRRVEDISGMGRGNDIDEDNNNIEEEDSNSVAPETEDGYIKVNQLSMNEFRRRLITHFNIAFKQNIVKWPSRNKIVN